MSAEKIVSTEVNDLPPLSTPKKSEEVSSSGRVDINILKSKLQESESKEFKKNIYILSILVIGLSVIGIYLSL